MTKRGIIVLLIAINFMLLSTLILMRWDPPSAYAQGVPLAHNYLMVTAEVRDNNDGLYVLDLSQRRLYVFIANRDVNDRGLFLAGARDLMRDFRGTP